MAEAPRRRLADRVSSSPTFVGVGTFLAASSLGLWSCVSMALVGEGTPLPASTGRRLVIVGRERGDVDEARDAIVGAIREYSSYWAWVSPAEMPPNYNVAPTQQVLVAREQDGKHEGVAMRWGLIPSWAKDKKIAQINARADTAAENLAGTDLLFPFTSPRVSRSRSSGRRSKSVGVPHRSSA